MANKLAYEELGSSSAPDARRRPSVPGTLLLALCTAVATATVLTCNNFLEHSATPQHAHHVPFNAEAILSQCASLRETPGPPANFLAREESDRFEPGTKPTLIKNARIWTGARNGTEIVYGDVFLDKGVVKGIGYIPEALYARRREVTVIDAKGSWVTPGLGAHVPLALVFAIHSLNGSSSVDLHSHVGVSSSPDLHGAQDVNSEHGPILPWLRSIDGFNTHDDAFQLAIAGGVTSVQVLPGSGNAIGMHAHHIVSRVRLSRITAGQAFMFKLRTTLDRTPSSMVLEPPHSLNGTSNSEHSLRWRHLK